MRIDLTCPVELWHCQLPTDAYPVLTMEVYNLSDKEVDSLQVCVLCYDAEGERFARRVERVQGLEAPSCHAFEAAVPAEEGVDAHDLEVLIEKVWFGDGTVWRRGANASSEFVPSPLLEGDRLRVMQELAGRDAASYPSDQGAVWVCVCGRANAAKEDHCRRCHRDKHEIFTKLNQAAIERIIFQRQNAREEALRRQREKERRIAQELEQKKKRRRRIRNRILISVGSVVAVCALAYGIYFHGIPYYRYYMASRALENSQYENAKEQFLALGEYRDCAEMALECDYRMAMAALNGGTYTSLRAAQNGFDALGDYKDSPTRAQEARYVNAEKYLAAGNYADAIALYDQVPAYSDARMKRNQAEYLWAVELMEDGEFAQAREKFLALGDYQSAAVNALECLYRPAGLALDAGKPLDAIDYYLQIPDYRDSAMQLQRAYYVAGGQHYDEGDYDAAADYFLLAGDYLDAYRRAAACLYTPAVTAMDAGEYARAAGMFEKITNYQDAKALLTQCIYQQGLAEMEGGRYEAAIAFFDRIPELQLAQDARQECVYRPAMAALEEGNRDAALSLLLTIPGYKDVDDTVQALRFDLAIEYMNARDYAAAIPLFEALGNYRTSSDELLNARYGYALSLLDAGNYEDAIPLLTGLGDFENAPAHLLHAQYLKAQALADAGDASGALSLLEPVADQTDEIKTLYRACSRRLAQDAADAGNLAEAARLYLAVPGDEEAQAMGRELAYQAAAQLESAEDFMNAAQLYGLAGSYQDAAQKADACADRYYSGAYAAASAAMEEGDYLTVIQTLEPFARQETLNGKYADIPRMYKEACYQYANALYSDQRPFEALPYYEALRGYADVDEKRLNRTVYRMIGVWESTKGVVMEFRRDGTCTIDGRDSYYSATTYALNIGDRPDELRYAYNIVSISNNALTLLHEKQNVYYRMTRVTQP